MHRIGIGFRKEKGKKESKHFHKHQKIFYNNIISTSPISPSSYLETMYIEEFVKVEIIKF